MTRLRKYVAVFTIPDVGMPSTHMWERFSPAGLEYARQSATEALRAEFPDGKGGSRATLERVEWREEPDQ